MDQMKHSSKLHPYSAVKAKSIKDHTFLKFNIINMEELALSLEYQHIQFVIEKGRWNKIERKERFCPLYIGNRVYCFFLNLNPV